jgi:DNA-binding FadR family transcriptional regulator
MTAQPVRIPKAATLVAASLRRRIVLGELNVGEGLPTETELMALYEVSRPTLREALRILEAESLIVVKRGAQGGARVSRPESSVTARHAALLLHLQGTTVQEVFDARLIIEPAAVALVAERAQDDPSLLDPLHELHEQASHLLDDPLAYASTAAKFHVQLIELAGNRTLTLMASILLEIVEPNNQATVSNAEGVSDLLVDAQRQHELLLKHLRLGKAQAATKCWHHHMGDARSETLNALGRDTLISYLEMAL